MATAKELRATLRAQRAAISMPMVEREQRLADQVMAHPAIVMLEPGAWVTCYSSYRDEPPTRLLLQRLCDAGFEVAVPAVHGENLHWHDVTGEVDDPKAWTRDEYGIPRPTTPEIATSASELLALGVRVVITPGLGMERSGARIGQGGGFYDRTLADVEGPIVVALVFEDEMADELPTDPHDRGVDVAVTDQRVRWFTMPD